MPLLDSPLGALAASIGDSTRGNDIVNLKIGHIHATFRRALATLLHLGPEQVEHVLLPLQHLIHISRQLRNFGADLGDGGESIQLGNLPSFPERRRSDPLRQPPRIAS